MFAASTLACQAFVVFFAALAAYGLRAADTGLIIGVGTGTAVLCIVAAGMLRSRMGYWLGSAIQVFAVVMGAIFEPLRIHLLPVAIVFALVWIASLRVGARIDRERAERYRAELAQFDAAAVAGDATTVSDE